MKIPYKYDLVVAFLIVILSFLAITPLSQAVNIIMAVMIVLARDIKIRIDNKENSMKLSEKKNDQYFSKTY